MLSRIAQQIALAFGVEIDKDVVRRLPSVHYRPEADSGGGPSWLAFLGHNLRVLEVAEIMTVPYVPISHPFVERLIGTVRRVPPDPILDHG